MREIIVDSFAGGGGASEGIRLALGRDPDVAVNHDRLALAMHRANHPDTHHLVEDVWHVDPVGTCAGRPVGLFWMSPDCKHFSKAKGGKPREKQIRGLAWVGLRWVKNLPKAQRPRVLILENVEEFQDWGPLLEDGKPCPVQKGATFREFVRAFEALGYVVEWRELRACDYGAPTIRKRLFLIARRDGRPIVWPAPTHGAPTSDDVRAGRLRPWRTAAEIIDWSLPCPSIFDNSAQIKARYGIRANRPLAEATMARIAKGTMRYVVQAAKPFLVRTDMTSAFRRNGVNPVDEPLRTQTTSGSHAVAVPFVSYAQQGGASRDVAAPLHTITASPKDHNTIVAPFVTKFNRGATGHPLEQPLATVTAHSGGDQGGGAAPLGIVAPFVAPVKSWGGGGNDPRPVEEPARTVTASKRGEHAIVSGFLVPRYGERPGQDPRARSMAEPAPVVVPTENEGSLAAVHLSAYYGEGAGGTERGSPAAAPLPTDTAGGNRHAVVAAFLAQHNTARDGAVNPGCDVRAPVSTITAAGGHQNLVAAHLSHAYTSNTRGGEGDPGKPLKTIMAGGNHAAAVYAFLQSYYGSELDGQRADAPVGAETTKPRHGVVTVTVEGQPYAIVDIGMRMLTPRERFNAQGFRPDYEIETGILEDGSTVAFTLEQQGRACGNSVAPPIAAALVAANYREAEVRPRPVADHLPLFLPAAE